MKKIKKMLENFDISPSIHRLKIYEYIRNNRNHPTAEMIYSALSDDIPTLSKTTVYNTLHMFVEKGLLMNFALANNEVRYDIPDGNHAHFRCRKCNSIFDIEQEFSCLSLDEIEGHKVENQTLNLQGICRNCRKD